MPAIGEKIVVFGSMRPFSWKVAIAVVVEAENLQLVARRFQRGLRRAHVVLRLDQGGLRLLIILQRHRLALEQILGAGVLQLRQIERRLGLVQAGHGGDEIVLRLHGVGGFDHEQRLALRDLIARLHHQPGRILAAISKTSGS